MGAVGIQGLRGTPGGVGGASSGGLGGLLVPGFLPAHLRAQPQLSSPRQASGPSPTWPWGPACLLFTGKPAPESESQPGPWSGGGTTDGGNAILTSVCSSWGRRGGTLGLVGAGTLRGCHPGGPHSPIPLLPHLLFPFERAVTHRPCHLGCPPYYGPCGCPLGLQVMGVPPPGGAVSEGSRARRVPGALSSQQELHRRPDQEMARRWQGLE